MSLTNGTRLGNYEIVAPLGAGGMGEVYRARDTRLDRPVAIKALPDAFARDPERAARFEREARMLASVQHANIAVIYGIEDAGGASYLALELVEGETLAQRLARGPLTIEETLQVGAQIASAIDAAHEQGVVHRDLKPSNVMITPSGAVKVLDFGLAKAGPAASDASSIQATAGPTMAGAATAAGVILGTAPYMSPEQARGKAVDRRTDVWALGCVLFECLTGKQVFPGETTSDVLARILERDPDWMLLPAAVPARLRELLRRCLTKNAADRPKDAGDLRGEMLAIALELSAPASNASNAAPGVVPPSVAVLYFENPSSESENDYFCAGITEDILTDLSKVKGMRVASRNAVARYRGSSVDIAQVARELGVGSVLEGSVRRAGDRVRITAQLISADGFHLWAERYDRTLDDVFAVQDEIASSIARALQVALTPAEAERMSHDRPSDVRAYDLYLKGRERYRQYMPDAMLEAVRLFEQAIEVDPSYALAYAGIGDAMGQLLQWGLAQNSEETIRRGLEAARRAIALNPGLAEGHKAEALVLRFSGDHAGSVAALRRAVSADPRHVPALGNLGVHLFCVGDVAGSERAFRRAAMVEPDDAFSAIWVATILGMTGRVDAAETILTGLIGRSKDSFFVTVVFGGLAWIRWRRQDLRGVEACMKQGREAGAELANMSIIEAFLKAEAGRVDEAKRLLAQATESKVLNLGSLMFAAMTVLRLGELGRAIEFFGRRIAQDSAPVLLRLEDELHPLLDHPPFAPRRSDLTLVWPVEAPMIDARRLALFKEVRIASAMPGGSSLLDEE